MPWRSDTEALVELGGLCRPGPTFRVVLPDRSTRLMPLDAIAANIAASRAELNDFCFPEATVMAEACTQATGTAIDVHILCGKSVYAVSYLPG